MLGNHPAEARATECAFCGALVFSGRRFLDGIICHRCELYTLYSDLYKDENGFRPHDDPSIKYMEAWIAAYDLRHKAN